MAIRDITQRKQAELALAKLNNESEERVKSRTRQLEQVNSLLLATTSILEERNQELDQFAYIASHDLKAPLRAIANLSSWIQEDLADKLDDGKGIDPQYHDRIFTIFQTLEAKDRQENTGIGLSIVKKAVENQGGKVSVRSELGFGTTFKFTWRKSDPGSS